MVTGHRRHNPLASARDKISPDGFRQLTNPHTKKKKKKKKIKKKEKKREEEKGVKRWQQRIHVQSAKYGRM